MPKKRPRKFSSTSRPSKISSAGWSGSDPIEVNDDYSFSLSFWGEKNQLATIDVAELKTVVEQIKPAHLRFVISGITWADLESVNMTWKYFEDNPTTWAQLESMFCIHAKE